MIRQKVTRIAQVGFSDTCEPHSPPFEHSGDLAKLFEGLSKGEMPNFLDMMSAISEISYEMTADFGPCIDCQRG
ncbi:hypothetical protein KAR91_60410 [Candidatus Pacearchaeota archaeon]|nr:hypothetical protein [Candidatus Pacearchaeota archaeon]